MPSLTRLTSQRMLDDTMTVLRTHIPLQAAGYRCQTDDLWRVLVAATAQTRSIEAACASLVTAPHPNTIRGYLTRQWTPEALPTLEAQCNAALQASIPAWLKDRPVEVAIDTHDSPFYGRLTGAAASWVCGGQSRAGTNRHYRCATVAVLARQARVTVAVTFVQPGETMDAIVARLLTHLDRLSLQIGCLYADKGFCSVAIFQRLLAAKIPAIIAVPQRSDGLRALAQGSESHWESYTLTSRTAGQVTIRLAVVRTYAKQRTGGYQLRWCLFACLGVRDSLIGVRRRYRKRFGIESLYRHVELLRLRTTATNPAVRFMALAIALILLNVWVWFHWTYLRVPGCGPRRVDQTSLRLRRLMAMLHHAVVTCYGELAAIPLASYRPYQIEPANL